MKTLKCALLLSLPAWAAGNAEIALNGAGTSVTFDQGNSPKVLDKAWMERMESLEALVAGLQANVTELQSRTNQGSDGSGGEISDALDGSQKFRYHAFKTTGAHTFRVNNAGAAEVLIVAGGGSGGGQGDTDGSGGGGAGGVVFKSISVLPGTVYDITVGAGGAGVGFRTNGNKGGDSKFGSHTATGGGGGGSETSTARKGQDGGSGGGGGGYSGGPGIGIPGQGNNGGRCTGPGDGGGGGAGAVGVDGGAGGDGVSTYSAWGQATGTGEMIGNTWYFGGGGGSSADPRRNGACVVGPAGNCNPNGGKGGGGRGGDAKSGSNVGSGKPNTGGGGGGPAGTTPTGGNHNSGSGGSGVVIVRYPIG